ncbi:MAG: TRAP transporter large permease subunit, partial [Desulfarculaceae bacterium]
MTSEQLPKQDRNQGGFFAKAFGLALFAWVLLHIYVVLTLPISLDELKVVHMGLGLAFVFVAPLLSSKRRRLDLKSACWLALLLIAVVTTAFFYIDYENMIERTGFPSLSDVVAGTVLVSLVVIGGWRAWGFTIPVITLVVMAYAMFGNHLGGFFYHAGIDYPRFMGYCATYFMGALGGLPGLSASVIIHFILFGALLQACGGSELIEKISLVVGSRFRSGPAQTAIISSGFMGMVSGSTAANVAITGAFTIPLMKRRGFDPNFAGAVEAVASTGGQIMPPIMGVSAFIMASLTNRPYAQIVIAAFLPAMVYFLNLSFAVLVYSRKKNIALVDLDSAASPINFKEIFKAHGHLFIPLVILTWRVLLGETPARAIMYANGALILVSLLHTLIRHRGVSPTALKTFFAGVYSGFVKGGLEGAKLGVIIG